MNGGERVREKAKWQVRKYTRPFLTIGLPVIAQTASNRVYVQLLASKLRSENAIDGGVYYTSRSAQLVAILLRRRRRHLV